MIEEALGHTMWHVCHRASEIRIYFLEMQIWTRVAQDTIQSGAHCEVR